MNWNEIDERHAVLLVSRYYAERVRDCAPLGGGFYGKVFRISIAGLRTPLVVKLYRFPKLAAAELRQLQVLAAHASVRMPQVYMLHSADEAVPCDALVMEYIAGVNAGRIDVESISVTAVNRIADKVIDNLICYHSAENPLGFGEIGAEHYTSDWRDDYKPRVNRIYADARTLLERGELPPRTWSILELAYENYAGIFNIPQHSACLIHGDYNTWNVLLTADMRDVACVIDPFACRWADSEFDLYQLDNANGRQYRLLERYAERVKLSERFELKRAFYEVFTEIMHYHDAHVPLRGSAIPEQAERLYNSMCAFEII